MTIRVPVKPALLDWAEKRSGVAYAKIISKFKSFEAWKSGTKQPTLKQLESFANLTHTSVGYLFLSEPPDETIPIPDFRTRVNVEPGKVSPDLLDTIYICQQRQEWYRDYARLIREDPVPFIGTLSVKTDVIDAAFKLRSLLSFETNNRGRSWSDAFRNLVDKAESQGVLVMVNGVVGSNTHRKLNPDEFQGFAITDDLAPLIFINGADFKAAQIFTLAHELAHLLLGQSGVSNAEILGSANNKTEQWCNKVAAEFLVPIDDLKRLNINLTNLTDELSRLAHKYKVSTLVCLRRVFDAGFLNKDEFNSAYNNELSRINTLIKKSGGGDFYNTQPVRVSKRFAKALIESTFEGQTLYRDAFHLLGFKKVSTFNELASRLGVI
jgi:Zn-dependent peptidase ImmA (M78 family)